MIKGKKIVCGVTGGIAAYKAVDLVRLLCKRRAEVHVVMTENARQFVAPLTFQTVSGQAVCTDMFAPHHNEISHIALADRAHLLLIAPATANIIAKMAGGLADDLLSTVVLATAAPVLIAPAMNVRMWDHPATRQNVETLRARGFHFVGPASGELACGHEGRGRMAEPEEILEEALSLITPMDLRGERILVTAGPTEEPLDPVRMFTNRSSGKMGYALARAAQRRGAEVLLVTGPTALTPPARVQTVAVTTALEMHKAVLLHAKASTIIIKTAAVSDYRPKKIFGEKMKKIRKTLSLELERNPDILYQLGRNKGNRFLVGFAAETKNLISQAKSKLDRKNLDLIVVNSALQKQGGFGSDSNEATLIDYEGRINSLPLMDKEALADTILNKIKELKAEQATMPRRGKPAPAEARKAVDGEDQPAES
jgi:phosphopantothenoylcysteine decarboxylase/phosphopantothenate--cysteine ligase